MLSVLTGDNSFEIVYNEENKPIGGVSMCEFIQKLRDEGRNEGLLVGRNEGKKEAKTETAKKMISIGLPIETIMSVTDFSREEIEKIRSV